MSVDEFEDQWLVAAKTTLHLAALQGDGFSNETLIRGALQAIENWLLAVRGETVEKIIEDFTERASDRDAQPVELDLSAIVARALLDVDSLSGPKGIPD
jgi:hypothetical protein